MAEQHDHKIFISCKMATKLMSKSMEQGLSLFEKVQLYTHLFMCKTCVFCFRQVKSIQHTLSHYIDAISKIPPPSDQMLSENAKSRIRQMLINK